MHVYVHCQKNNEKKKKLKKRRLLDPVFETLYSRRGNAREWGGGGRTSREDTRVT